jgi:hypothetical protein
LLCLLPPGARRRNNITPAVAAMAVTPSRVAPDAHHRRCCRCNCLCIVIVSALLSSSLPPPPLCSRCCRVSCRAVAFLRDNKRICMLFLFVDCCAAALLLLLLPTAPLVSLSLVPPSLHAGASRPPAPLPLAAPPPLNALILCLFSGWLSRRLSSCPVHWCLLRLLCCQCGHENPFNCQGNSSG